MRKRLSPLKARTDLPELIPFFTQKVPKTTPITTFPFYDGELELKLSRAGFNLTGLTNKFVVNEFWTTLNSNPERLCNFIDFFENKPIEDIFFFLQKEWFKYKDPFSRSAFFFLLQNCSDQCMASKGNYLKPNEGFKSIVENWSSWQIRVDFVNVSDEEIYDFLVKKEHLFYSHCGRLSNEFIENNSAGIDETKISNKKLLNLMFDNFEPWILSFEKNDLVMNYASKKANIYFIDSYGKLCSKKTASFCLVTNV